jgi:hypothetical protein
MFPTSPREINLPGSLQEMMLINVEILAIGFIPCLECETKVIGVDPIFSTVEFDLYIYLHPDLSLPQHFNSFLLSNLNNQFPSGNILQSWFKTKILRCAHLQ